MSHEINIGILALQGDIEENIVATRDAMSSLSLNAYTTPVDTEDLKVLMA
jgi:glutamine amidotransferase PdxT